MGLRAAIAATAGLLTVAVPWATWIYAVSGAVFPESGRAVRQLIAIHQAHDIGSLATIVLSFCELGRLIPIDGSISLYATIAGLAVTAFLIVAAYRMERSPINLFLLCSLSLGVTYFLYLPAFWFFPRYLYPLFLGALAAWAVIVTHALQQHRAVSHRLLAGGLTVGLLFASLRQFPTLLGNSGGDAFHGYRAPALALVPHLSRFKLVGAAQSGALGYYAPPGTRVVNLDGVVNRSAYNALRDRTMDVYLRQVGIEVLAEYDFSTPYVSLRSVTPPRLNLVTRIPDSRKSQLALYSIAW
jgi:uncharacterized membrane protein (GlpM family)